MNDELLHKEWLARAEDDLKAVDSLFVDGLYALACFHAQQCAEKVLKAFLLKIEETIPKIHSLPELIMRCAKHEQQFETFREIAEQLDKFYRPTRYPDAMAGMLPEGWPSKEDATGAKDATQKLFDFVNQQLNQ